MTKHQLNVGQTLADHARLHRPVVFLQWVSLGDDGELKKKKKVGTLTAKTNFRQGTSETRNIMTEVTLNWSV